MLFHYLPPFHSDFMYMRSETQKPCLLIQVEKKLNTRNWVHPKLVEEPEVKEGGGSHKRSHLLFALRYTQMHKTSGSCC